MKFYWNTATPIRLCVINGCLSGERAKLRGGENWTETVWLQSQNCSILTYRK